MTNFYQALKAPNEDLKTVKEVADYIEEIYSEPLTQGPIWITGSSLHNADPGDYDIVVQRNFQEVPTEADQRAVVNILNQFQEESLDTETGTHKLNDQLESSKYVETGSNVNLYPEPVRRFQMEISEVPIDLSFNNEEPVDDAVKILE